MVPDLDLQLQVSMKALTDTVLPAVDQNNKMAVEQLQLVLGTLNMVRQRMPSARRFTRRLLEDAIATATTIKTDLEQAGDNASVLTDHIGRAQAALASPELDTVELEDFRAQLNSAMSATIAAAPEGVAIRLGKHVLEGAKQPITRLRAWCLLAGFEPNAESLPALEALL